MVSRWRKSGTKILECPVRVFFKNFVSLLRPYIECQVTHMRIPVSPETQVALTLYYLSDEGRLRKVANAFGLSRSCCSMIIRRVSAAITSHLGPVYIKLPMNEESVMEKYRSSSMHFLFHSV